ncbi:MAG: hypothetical protein Tsb002_37080 [Wenzhouxiangellaceae bacterium]
MTQDVIFVSHGMPTVALGDSPSIRHWRDLGQRLQQRRPQAVLVISAHWQTEPITLGSAAQPETIHDFYGFDEALYSLQYPAPGNPGLAAMLARDLRQAGWDAVVDDRQGMDHGAWIPLRELLPDAATPVIPLALPRTLDARQLLQLGRDLARYRQQGIAIIASGASSHNLRAILAGQPMTQPPAWLTGFQQWLRQQISANQIASLVTTSRRPLICSKTIRRTNICGPY